MKEQLLAEFREKFAKLYAPDFSWEKLEERPYVLLWDVEQFISRAYEAGSLSAYEAVEAGLPKELPEKLGTYGLYDQLHIQSNIGKNEMRKEVFSLLCSLKAKLAGV